MINIIFSAILSAWFISTKKNKRPAFFAFSLSMLGSTNQA